MATGDEKTLGGQDAVELVLRPEGDVGVTEREISKAESSLGEFLAKSGAGEIVQKNFKTNFEQLGLNKVVLEQSGTEITIDDQITMHVDMFATMATDRVVLLSKLSKRMAEMEDGEELSEDEWGKEKSKEVGKTRGGGLDASKKERLRLKFHLDMVAPFLAKLGLQDQDMPEDLRKNERPAVTRVFDLVNDGYRKDDGTLRDIEVKQDMKKGSAFATKMGKAWQSEGREYTGRQHVELMQFYTSFVKNKRQAERWDKKKQLTQKAKEIAEVKIPYYATELSPLLADLALSLDVDGDSRVAALLDAESFSDLSTAFIKQVNERFSSAEKSPEYLEAENKSKLEFLYKNIVEHNKKNKVKKIPPKKGGEETNEQLVERFKEIIGDDETYHKILKTGEKSCEDSKGHERKMDLAKDLAAEWKEKILKMKRSDGKVETLEVSEDEVIEAYKDLDEKAQEPAGVTLEIGSLWDDDEIREQVRAQAAKMTFTSKSAAVYHAEKHFAELVYSGFAEVKDLIGDELPERADTHRDKQRSKARFVVDLPPEERLAVYVDSARKTVNAAEAVEVKVQQSGGRMVTSVRGNSMKALTGVAQSKTAFILTYMQAG